MSLLGGIFQGAAALLTLPIPLELVGFASTMIYVLVTGSCLYSIAVSLSGALPSGLGVLSEIAEFQIFDTAPSDGEEDTSKFFDRPLGGFPSSERGLGSLKMSQNEGFREGFGCFSGSLRTRRMRNELLAHMGDEFAEPNSAETAWIDLRSPICHAF